MSLVQIEDTLVRARSLLDQSITQLSTLRGAQPGIPRQPLRRTQRGRRPRGRVSMREAAIRALEKCKLSLSELHAAVTKLGATSSADDPKNVLYQTLYKARKNGEIVLDDDGKYRLP